MPSSTDRPADTWADAARDTAHLVALPRPDRTPAPGRRRRAGRRPPPHRRLRRRAGHPRRGRHRVAGPRPGGRPPARQPRRGLRRLPAAGDQRRDGQRRRPRADVAQRGRDPPDQPGHRAPRRAGARPAQPRLAGPALGPARRHRPRHLARTGSSAPSSWCSPGCSPPPPSGRRSAGRSRAYGARRTASSSSASVVRRWWSSSSPRCTSRACSSRWSRSLPTTWLAESMQTSRWPRGRPRPAGVAVAGVRRSARAPPPGRSGSRRARSCACSPGVHEARHVPEPRWGSPDRALLRRLDRGSVWRSVGMRRGLMVLGLGPGLVALVAGLAVELGHAAPRPDRERRRAALRRQRLVPRRQGHGLARDPAGLRRRRVRRTRPGGRRVHGRSCPA